MAKTATQAAHPGRRPQPRKHSTGHPRRPVRRRRIGLLFGVVGLLSATAISTQPAAAMDYPPISIDIKSQVATSEITTPTDGETALCDEVWLVPTDPADMWWRNWGTKVWEPLTITGALHHAAVPTAPILDFADVPKVADFTATFTNVGRENSQTLCHDIDAGQHGAFGFTFTLDRDSQTPFAGGLLAASVTTLLWDPAETTIVRAKPAVDTTASWVRDEVGNVTFTDQINMSGWPTGPDSDNPLFGAVEHGQWPGHQSWLPDLPTVVVELWRINTTNDTDDRSNGGAVVIDPDACHEDNPDAVLSNYVETPASNTGSDGIRVDLPVLGAPDGVYTFVIDFAGDSRVAPFRATCGEASETVVVTPPDPTPSPKPSDPTPSTTPPTTPNPSEPPPGPSKPPTPAVTPPVKQHPATGTNWLPLALACTAATAGGVVLVRGKRRREEAKWRTVKGAADESGASGGTASTSCEPEETS